MTRILFALLLCLLTLNGAQYFLYTGTLDKLQDIRTKLLVCTTNNTDLQTTIDRLEKEQVELGTLMVKRDMLTRNINRDHDVRVRDLNELYADAVGDSRTCSKTNFKLNARISNLTESARTSAREVREYLDTRIPSALIKLLRGSNETNNHVNVDNVVGMHVTGDNLPYKGVKGGSSGEPNSTGADARTT